MKRTEYAELITKRLDEAAQAAQTEFAQPDRVRSFVVDELLPPEAARELYAAFPEPRTMMKRHSLRESKYFAAQMDKYNPLLEEILFAFQEPSVVNAIGKITNIDGLLPDPQLYAGGVSMMVKGSFLNPHLDNSHHFNRKVYRVLNALYYVTPDWKDEYGGNLELWDRGPQGSPRVITSKFNRLVVMETNRKSWHSVNEVVADARRTCVSNYFFREKSLENEDYFHATSFRGRPEQRARDLLLRADNLVRTRVLTAVNLPIRHIYKKKSAT